MSGLHRPVAARLGRLHGLAAVSVASLLIALSAQLAVPLPFTPVPVTLQTLAVLLTGAALGSRRGALAVALVLAEGAIGLPVFSAWRGGLAHLVGPTGGYLVGFVAAAFVTGSLCERGWDRKPFATAAAMLAGNAAIYAVGLPWLALATGRADVLALGLYPFVAGDALKIAVATGLLPLGRAALSR